MIRRCVQSGSAKYSRRAINGNVLKWPIHFWIFSYLLSIWPCLRLSPNSELFAKDPPLGEEASRRHQCSTVEEQSDIPKRLHKFVLTSSNEGGWTGLPLFNISRFFKTVCFTGRLVRRMLHWFLGYSLLQESLVAAKVPSVVWSYLVNYL